MFAECTVAVNLLGGFTIKLRALSVFHCASICKPDQRELRKEEAGGEKMERSLSVKHKEGN